MPELPEVETVRRSLENLVVGKTISHVEIRWPKIIQNPEVDQFQDALQGQKITAIGRKGKFLIFQLDDYALVSHLRMEGNYRLHNNEDESDKHTHVLFYFTDDTVLYYRDVRKFGTMHLFKKGTEENELPLAKLGPEPFSEDCTVRYLQEKFRKTTRSIKAVLLDQQVIAGLGNIYVDEVLFRAKIHPERIANTLSEEEIERIHHEAIFTLKEAIQAGGSSVNSYMDSHGVQGTYQNFLHVYGRTGEPCSVCETPIQKLRVAGRGTHICPTCQIK